MITEALPQYKRERASDAVYQIIRERILTHFFPPGMRLNLREVAEKIGVSMTPVKDAVNRLENEGLIEVRPQSGTYVTQIVADEVAEIFEIRMALECFAAERAVNYVDRASIEKLRRILDELEQPTPDEQARSAYVNRDFEFHTQIVALSNNKTLLEFYHGVDARIKVARMLYSNERWTRRVKQASSEHNEILERLQAKDGEGLVKALRRHLERVSRALVEDLRQLAEQECWPSQPRNGPAMERTSSS
ncbi:MAG: GntR family transcriptional regulator [Acidobacteria bacterium]|nr:GntR family transcriptional regulator [Acidobacteriota bacterium]